MTTTAVATRKSKRAWMLMLILLFALYVVLPQLGSFHRSLIILHGAQKSYLLLGLLWALLSYPAAATTYYLLAFRRLRYARTLLVQVGSTFANRLLPAGIGSIGVYYEYLRRSRHSQTQAASVITANNVLGFIGHMILLGCLVGLQHSRLAPLHIGHISRPSNWLWMGLIIIAPFVGLAIQRYGRHFLKKIREFLLQLACYRMRLPRVALALASSMALTLCNVLSLWSCSQALHGGLSFVTALIIFTFGIMLGTATPTPGGLGGVEAGLIAGMVAYHMDSATALAITLVYRLMSYWLALIAGAVAFSVCQRRGYL